MPDPFDSVPDIRSVLPDLRKDFWRIEKAYGLKIAEVLGAGSFGAAFATSEPGKIVKVSVDPSEGPIWKRLMDTGISKEERGIATCYAVNVMPGTEKYDIYRVWVILREAVYPVNSWEYTNERKPYPAHPGFKSREGMLAFQRDDIEAVRDWEGGEIAVAIKRFFRAKENVRKAHYASRVIVVNTYELRALEDRERKIAPFRLNESELAERERLQDINEEKRKVLGEALQAMKEFPFSFDLATLYEKSLSRAGILLGDARIGNLGYRLEREPLGDKPPDGRGWVLFDPGYSTVEDWEEATRNVSPLASKTKKAVKKKRRPAKPRRTVSGISAAMGLRYEDFEGIPEL